MRMKLINVFIAVTKTAANERISRVQHLKAKKLQRFITKTQQEIKKKIADKQAKVKTKSAPVKTNKLRSTSIQPVEYQKISMEALDNSSLLGTDYDDKPMIFFGKDDEVVLTHLNNPEKIEQIIKSFHNFRDILEGLEHDNIENDDYR